MRDKGLRMIVAAATFALFAAGCNQNVPTLQVPGLSPIFTLPAGLGSPTPNGAIHKYGVVLLPAGGTLSAYAAAGGTGTAIASIPGGFSGLLSTGNVAMVGTDTWVKVNLPTGGTGWVKRINLTEVVAKSNFCGDSRVTALFPQLLSALNSNDGRILEPLVSPVHGLFVQYIHNGIPQEYIAAQALTLFGSSNVVNWGMGPGSGAPVNGTFEGLVRPDLRTVFGAAYESHCDTIALGGASYTVTWPDVWTNFNYYSIYKPGPAGNELSWMTWLAGVDYVDGQPYLFSLSRYNWEP